VPDEKGVQYRVALLCQLRDWSGELVEIPSTMIFISEECFFKCLKLKNIVFENVCQVQLLGVRAFAKAEILAGTIPQSVGKIDVECFSRCTDLRSVE
jgi:hypothetical protein